MGPGYGLNKRMRLIDVDLADLTLMLGVGSSVTTFLLLVARPTSIRLPSIRLPSWHSLSAKKTLERDVGSWRDFLSIQYCKQERKTLTCADSIAVCDDPTVSLKSDYENLDALLTAIPIDSIPERKRVHPGVRTVFIQNSPTWRFTSLRMIQSAPATRHTSETPGQRSKRLSSPLCTVYILPPQALEHLPQNPNLAIFPQHEQQSVITKMGPDNMTMKKDGEDIPLLSRS
jgi:hypothetical protein